MPKTNLQLTCVNDDDNVAHIPARGTRLSCLIQPPCGWRNSSPSSPRGGEGLGEEASILLNASSQTPTRSSRGEEENVWRLCLGATTLVRSISVCPNRRGPRRFCGARLCEPQHVDSDRRAGFVKMLGGRHSSCGSQTRAPLVAALPRCELLRIQC